MEQIIGTKIKTHGNILQSWRYKPKKKKIKCILENSQEKLKFINIGGKGLYWDRIQMRKSFPKPVAMS